MADAETLAPFFLGLPEFLLPVSMEERIRQLEEYVASQDRVIESYQLMHETDSQIIDLLKESGPGSLAMQAVEALDELAMLRSEVTMLREWKDRGGGEQ